MLQSCDTMVAIGAATAHGQTLFAKNSDRPASECQPLVLRERGAHPEGAVVGCQFLELPEVRETWRHVGSRPYWCWGYEHGFNEHQVVIGNEALGSRIRKPEPKLIGMELLRLGLERGRTAAEAVEVMTEFISRYGQGWFQADGVVTYDNGYIVADPHEAYILETAERHWAVERVGTTAGISNVYSIGKDWDRISPEAEAEAERQGWWEPRCGRLNFAAAFSDEQFRLQGVERGGRRRARSCAVLQQEAGHIDAAAMMALLSDHSDGVHPEEPLRTDPHHRSGLCMHCQDDGTGGNTAASLVADLCADGSRLPVYWCSFYSPCLGIFFPVFSEGTLPAVLSSGGAERSDNSPWWLFHRLSHAVLADPEKRVPVVRQRWAELQRGLLESAYPVAREGRRLLESAQDDAARQMLTEYMDENLMAVLRAASELCRSFERPC